VTSDRSRCGWAAIGAVVSSARTQSRSALPPPARGFDLAVSMRLMPVMMAQAGESFAAAAARFQGRGQRCRRSGLEQALRLFFSEQHREVCLFRRTEKQLTARRLRPGFGRRRGGKMKRDTVAVHGGYEV